MTLEKTPMPFFLGERFFAGIFWGKKSTPKITGKVVERLKRFLLEDWVIVWELMKGYGRCFFPKGSIKCFKFDGRKTGNR